MKKFTLIALAIMASATSFAQTSLWNGEDKALNTDGGMWADRCDPKVVVNPDKNNDVNTSDKCLEFTINDKENDWENRAIAWNLASDNEIYQERVLSLKIKKAKKGNVKIDLDCGDGKHVFTAQWYNDENTWQKLYFAFPKDQTFEKPKVITIFANTEKEDVGQKIYIDDIMIEAQPKVGDKVLSEVNNISGNVTLTGTWLNFTCANPLDWKTPITYNSYNDFNNKSANTLTSVDITGAEAHDVDIDQFFKKNPNTIVYANANDTYKDHANVVIAEKAATVTLNDAYAFNIPYGFEAATVTLKRNLQGGINSFVCLSGLMQKI